MNKRLAMLVLLSSGFTLAPMSHLLYGDEEAGKEMKTEQMTPQETTAKTPDTTMEKSGSEQPKTDDCPHMDMQKSE